MRRAIALLPKASADSRGENNKARFAVSLAGDESALASLESIRLVHVRAGHVRETLVSWPGRSCSTAPLPLSSSRVVGMSLSLDMIAPAIGSRTSEGCCLAGLDSDAGHSILSCHPDYLFCHPDRTRFSG